ncbi:hypothetical protein CCR75_001688 [Bremia lactucae]|uniref:FYVE-type domain-containing protein n=1 Tax=Bremia lactucae TaxID=4779 RepID=A0A976IAI2_BRELC|nr:hypothetical protein CCR75_001688 [Bremia lactucae]
MTEYCPSTGSVLAKNSGSVTKANTDERDNPKESELICVKECERLATLAKRMITSLLEATDLLGGIPWELVHEKHGVSLFRADAATNVPCNVHAVSRFTCNIEDVAASLITPTTASFKQMMAMLSSDFVDGAVVHNIIMPTPAAPHRHVALKWAAFKSSGPFAKDRDLLMLEYVDMIEDVQGQRTAFRIMESIDTPVGLSAFAESPKYTRDLVPLIGFMYHSTKRSGELRMTYTCNFDKNGDLPAWVANSAIQSHVEKCINGILKYTESFRVGREEIVLPQNVVPMGEQDHCRICSKKFCVRRRRYNCLKCGDVCCSSCSSVRSTHVPEIGERQLRVCTACVIKARELSRYNKSSLEQSRAPSLSSKSTNWLLDDKNRILGRAQSFSVSTRDTEQEITKRRSYDDLLDPVRCRLIEYKAFSSGSCEGATANSAMGVPKANFPGRSFSDGLVMRNKALFSAKRRGSPADLAISIEAFRLHQSRMGNTERQPEDGSDDIDNHTDDESTTSSSSGSPTFSMKRRPFAFGPMHTAHSCIHGNTESNRDDNEGFEGAMARAKNIIIAANYANGLAQQARKLSHNRAMALQQGQEDSASTCQKNSDIDKDFYDETEANSRNRHCHYGSDFETAGAVLFTLDDAV